MIERLLIANRGEIACRIIRTARKLGIHTIAVYSEADATAQHVQQADSAYAIGPAEALASYLNQEVILQVAKRARADAIHPGYGFLSENAAFATACQQHGIIFIGPPADAIRAMGSKAQAKYLMEQANVPLTPGYHGDDQHPQTLAKAAAEIGYPVMLKASAGGGGKGMRIVQGQHDFDEQLAAAMREAQNAFGDTHMLVEKYIQQPRHVEVQVFCDNHGSSVYLFDRDCSVQRRHQKIVEEAPAPNITQATRTAMGQAAVAAAQAIQYVGAGTVEFLLDANEQFYFMEMNTRLQVEHPVTEAITGEDLVAWQIRIANGAPLPCKQAELRSQGHAVELRVYAEDPMQEFLPQTGRLGCYREPQLSSCRVDSGVIENDSVSIYYDPMISKVIVHAATREQAIMQLARALDDYIIQGCATNLRYLQRILQHPAFVSADITTDFIQHYSDDLVLPDMHQDPFSLAILAVCAYNHWQDSYPVSRQFRLNHTGCSMVQLTADITATVYADNQGNYLVRVDEQVMHIERFVMDAQGYINAYYCDEHYQGCYSQSASHRYLTFAGADMQWAIPSRQQPHEQHSEGHHAPMNGRIVSLNCAVGEAVKAGDTLLVMEAMKMEHAIKASQDGQVTAFLVDKGMLVDGGAPLLEFTASA